ncbi:MAG: hypothetical protein QOE00_2961, partial [Ilumatobacteraceae bacterium]
LYEGYVLYPYRASAQKNQLRWQFGVLAPRHYAEDSGSERWSMRTQVIVDPGDGATLHVRLRCLQVQRRVLERTADGGTTFEPTDSLDHDGRTIMPWDEAREREIDVEPIALFAADGVSFRHEFVLPQDDDVELLRDHRAAIVGRAIRRCEEVRGAVRVNATSIGDDRPLLQVTIDVENITDWAPHGADRDTAMRRSLVAVHTLLAVDDATFESLLEPAEAAEQAVARCDNQGTFPVLIGDQAARDVMLSSPIILYDFPAVAPESAGQFCDSTEIDEILALRVMTLTDEEKAEARGTDPRAAAIVDRCDDMPEEIWTRMHGAVRSLRPVEPAAVERASDIAPDHGAALELDPRVPWWDPGQDSSFDPFTDAMQIGGVEVTSGTRVRLNPSRRADAHDLFYAGRMATVKGIFNDVDGDQHVAVTLDDDPASDILEWQGRFLYFHPDEIEVVS